MGLTLEDRRRRGASDCCGPTISAPTAIIVVIMHLGRTARDAARSMPRAPGRDFGQYEPGGYRLDGRCEASAPPSRDSVAECAARTKGMRVDAFRTAPAGVLVHPPPSR